MSTTALPPQDPTAPVQPDLSPSAITVLEDRYLTRDDEGRITETPTELFRRVARAVAAAEETWGTTTEERQRIEEEYYRLMATRTFLPNSPTLMNAGRRLGMLSACFVLPLGDSIEEIMETARQIALVQRAGGGTGIDLSALRPKDSIVRSSGGTTDGPLSFLRMLSGVTEAIQQGAFRRGANMGVMRIDHPDILAFINVKSDPTERANYNLSVAITNDFMESLKAHPNQPHRVLNPHTGRQGVLFTETGAADYDAEPQAGDRAYYTAGEVWQEIVQRAWLSGEPGLVFIDEINHHNPTPRLGEIRSTNPCGEQPLLPYEACNLGSINLAALYNPSSSGFPDERIDWNQLEETLELAVRFLDDAAEVNQYPTQEIQGASRATRKIGLG
jgi:ribonucleoside-diphosphate reductase alpha chain